MKDRDAIDEEYRRMDKGINVVVGCIIMVLVLGAIAGFLWNWPY